jgi:hypothetical protein
MNKLILEVQQKVGDGELMDEMEREVLVQQFQDQDELYARTGIEEDMLNGFVTRMGEERELGKA